MKLKPRHKMVLDYIARQGGSVTAVQFASLLAGEPRAIRSMFSSGLLEGDTVPAKMVSLSAAGWKAARGEAKAIAISDV